MWLTTSTALHWTMLTLTPLKPQVAPGPALPGLLFLAPLLACSSWPAPSPAFDLLFATEGPQPTGIPCLAASYHLPLPRGFLAPGSLPRCLLLSSSSRAAFRHPPPPPPRSSPPASSCPLPAAPLPATPCHPCRLQPLRPSSPSWRQRRRRRTRGCPLTSPPKSSQPPSRSPCGLASCSSTLTAARVGGWACGGRCAARRRQQQADACRRVASSSCPACIERALCVPAHASHVTPHHPPSARRLNASHAALRLLSPRCAVLCCAVLQTDAACAPCSHTWRRAASSWCTAPPPPPPRWRPTCSRSWLGC